MKVHLLDGTYELFRHHFGVPKGERDPADEVAATRGVLWSVLNLLEEGVTHLGVATDHVIESFRNDLWPGYKSSAGMPEELLAQFPLLEEALQALGVVVFPMVELEADDALAAAAVTASADPTVEQVVIMTPDKDLAQMVVGTRVVQFDRRAKAFTDEAGVKAKFGVTPESIPDWLALVGDSADGFPGLPGWGKTSASAVLAKYVHIEDIPEHHFRWDVNVRGASRLAASLNEQRELALLFRDLATLRHEAKVLGDVEELRWQGPGEGLGEMAARLRAWRFTDRVAALDRR
ncbi:MAG TPA: 5'-3' exonuclease H3TH domain-containing protein [Acidimicrobiales bacterium]|nr:5'-3' exonuclease H3TH domain-containing protein [Acidimicrobiales bacterium]